MTTVGRTRLRCRSVSAVNFLGLVARVGPRLARERVRRLPDQWFHYSRGAKLRTTGFEAPGSSVLQGLHGLSLRGIRSPRGPGAHSSPAGRRRGLCICFGLGRTPPLNDPGVRYTPPLVLLLSASGCPVALCDCCPRLGVALVSDPPPECLQAASACRFPAFPVSGLPRLSGLRLPVLTELSATLVSVWVTPGLSASPILAGLRRAELSASPSCPRASPVSASRRRRTVRRAGFGASEPRRFPGVGVAGSQCFGVAGLGY